MAGALDSLRRRVFAEVSFVNPSEIGFPAPESVDDLVTEPYWEFMGTSGTHSILDVLSVTSADDEAQSLATIRPLTAPESQDLFGTLQPSRADFGRASDSGQLYEWVHGDRGTGRAVVLWGEGAPAEIAFWGYSGD